MTSSIMGHTAVAGGGAPAFPADPACCDVGVGVPALVDVGVPALVVVRVPALVVVGLPALVDVSVPALVVVGVGVDDSILIPKHTDLSTTAAGEDKAIKQNASILRPS